MQLPAERRRLGLRIAATVLAGATVVALAPAAMAAEPVRTGVEQSPAVPDRGLQESLDALLKASGSSAALAEVRDHGRAVWRGAAGTGNLDSGTPARADGRFRIGSVTKTFVSTVVLQLVAEGRVELDAPVGRYLPGVVRNGDTITVRQLLNHTSGLFNYTSEPGFFADPEDEASVRRWLDEGRWTTHSARQLVDIANRHEPYFPPGTDWKYSNTNYIVAGMVIEKVTGRTWNEEVERRIIRPLGLRDTSMPTTAGAVPGRHAHGYFKLPSGRPVDVTKLNPSMAGAAGAGISSAADLTRFNAALLGGKLLGPAQLAEMKQTVDAKNGTRYGLGLVQLPSACGDLWGHTGGIPGYSTVLIGNADGTRQVALSQNPYEDVADQEAAGRAKLEFLTKAGCGDDVTAKSGRALTVEPHMLN
ncbi:serine hydrolase [Streptomyces sp. BR123]|uniref:serine hydrolase domain-containing protein n=1 Tax=Streptomyces sp. BR123 TaxID=2749828 RepID=UPI00211AAB0C|nr:serine hydrolase domain-containing protein [Streptomyces sp. BR123]